MKKFLKIFLRTIVFSPSLLILTFIISQKSFASKARMNSLGGDLTAFYYMNDSRNIFFNPSYVNLNKDFIIFEWGADNHSLGSEASPKSEGGFFKSVDNFNYGLYLGHEGGYTGRNKTNSSTILPQDNPLEVFIAGDAGIQWGASAKLSNSNDETTGVSRKNSALQVKVGAILGNLEGNILLDLLDKSTGGANEKEEYKGDLGYTLGVNYFLNDISIYTRLEHSGFDYKRSLDGKLDYKNEEDILTVGIGQIFQLNEKAKLFSDLHLENSKSLDKKNLSSTPSISEVKLLKLPFTLGLETPVREWLVLRASIKQNIYSNKTNASNKKQTLEKTTEVNAGGSIDFGKLKVDGVIGTTDTSGSSSKSGLLSFSNLLTQVSFNYWF
jgi:hypothetical protein